MPIVAVTKKILTSFVLDVHAMVKEILSLKSAATKVKQPLVVGMFANPKRRRRSGSIFKIILGIQLQLKTEDMKCTLRCFSQICTSLIKRSFFIISCIQ